MDTSTVSSCLIQAITDPGGWNVALNEICKYTNSDKALISLRDKKTSEIVIPEDVAIEFASPLIFGFDKAYVASYLEAYAAVDPWTKVECEQHPYFVYAMSRYLPPEKLRQSRFWDWLEPQGISDCVVCELGVGDTYWAALNLYFDDKDSGRADQVVARLKEILPQVQSSWVAARDFQIARAAEGSLSTALSATDMAAAVITSNGGLVVINEAMRKLLSEWSVQAGVGEKLILPENLPIDLGEDVPRIEIARSGTSKSRRHATLAPFQTIALSGGEGRQQYLLTITTSKRQKANAGRSIWDAPVLTERERTLVRLVAQGHKFREAQSEMGVSYPRIMQLWKSARVKLDFDDVTDLRLSHRLSQS